MHGRTPCVGAQAMGFNCSISRKVAVTAHLGEAATLIGAVKSETPLILPYIDGFPTAIGLVHRLLCLGIMRPGNPNVS